MAANILINREFLLQKVKPRIRIYFTGYFNCTGTNYATYNIPDLKNLFSLVFQILFCGFCILDSGFQILRSGLSIPDSMF